MISESMIRSDLSIKEYPCVYPGLLITARQYGEGMAWFLPSFYKFCELYGCRGTKLINSSLLMILLLLY